MRARGHPVLGVIAGLFFGIFLAADVMFFKISTLTLPVLIGCLAVGIVVGLLLGITGPFRRGRAAKAEA